MVALLIVLHIPGVASWTCLGNLFFPGTWELRYFDSEKWLNIQDFHEFYSWALYPEVSHCELFANISASY